MSSTHQILIEKLYPHHENFTWNWFVWFETFSKSASHIHRPKIFRGLWGRPPLFACSSINWTTVFYIGVPCNRYMYVVQRHVGVQRRPCTWSQITLDWLCSAYGNDKKTREWKKHLLCPLQRYTTNQNLKSCTCSTSNMFFKRIKAHLIR